MNDDGPPVLTRFHETALRASAESLGQEYAGIFGAETIERFLYSSYEEFAGRASISTFLPLLARRFARERLHAFAMAEGAMDVGMPTVLFLCVHNAGRSQMALGFFRALVGNRAIAWAGGSAPGGRINPLAVETMAERGIDISEEYPKPWTDEVVRAADVVVSMGCGDACPIYPGKRYENWVLEDPDGADIDDVRRIRDDVERRVSALVLGLELHSAV